jgi:hypothetical protein
VAVRASVLPGGAPAQLAALVADLGNTAVGNIQLKRFQKSGSHYTPEPTYLDAAACLCSDGVLSAMPSDLPRSLSDAFGEHGRHCFVLAPVRWMLFSGFRLATRFARRIGQYTRLRHWHLS